MRESPFAITPDPRFLYLGRRHQEALAHLLYSVRGSSGFVLLTGEVGTGKTTISRSLLEQLPEGTHLAMIFNPRLTALDLLMTIGQELGLQEPREHHSPMAWISTLNRHLLESHARGERTLLVIDEAQQLAPELLEQVRLLTNLETTREKLLQIILIGQPELNDTLARADLRQLAQRITACYHIAALDRAETAEYIRHRLMVAGCHKPLFSATALRVIYRASGGIPRLVNKICDRALLGGFVRGRERVGAVIALQSVLELKGTGPVQPRIWLHKAGLGVSLALGLMTIGFAARMEGWENTFSSLVLSQQFGTKLSLPSVVSPVSVAPVVVASTPLPAPVEVSPTPSLASVAVVSTSSPPPVVPVPPEANFTATRPILLEWLQQASVSSQENALREIYALWGNKEPEPAQISCTPGKTASFHCRQGRGNWNTLRQINRPAVLLLLDGKGVTHHTLITRLDDRSAQLRIGSKAIQAPLAEIDSIWFGRYIVVWRQPDPFHRLLGSGTQGSDVVWLRHQLAAQIKVPLAEPVSDQFDDSLDKQVRRFQASVALDPDGKVGPETAMLLTRSMVGSTPELPMPRLDGD
ncbi:MAG: AAA family ATPase [Magnetococcus sp. DMHC-1]